MAGRPTRYWYTTDELSQVRIRDVHRRYSREIPLNVIQVTYNGHAVRLDFTQPNYGGWRPWYLCPDCGRRCAVLYLVGPTGRPSCRLCVGVIHASTRERSVMRAFRRIRKLLRKLDEDASASGPIPARPRRMRHRTYQRIVGQLSDQDRELDLLFWESRGKEHSDDTGGFPGAVPSAAVKGL